MYVTVDSLQKNTTFEEITGRFRNIANKSMDSCFSFTFATTNQIFIEKSSNNKLFLIILKPISIDGISIHAVHSKNGVNLTTFQIAGRLRLFFLIWKLHVMTLIFRWNAHYNFFGRMHENMRRIIKTGRLRELHRKQIPSKHTSSSCKQKRTASASMQRNLFWVVCLPFFLPFIIMERAIVFR